MDFPQPLRIADDWEKRYVVYPSLARRIGVAVRRLDRLFIELAAGWESLEDHIDPHVDPADRARFIAGWHEHRSVYGYTLLAELPYALRAALRDHPDLRGVDYSMLIVDEYQDLNACDLAVLALLSVRGCSIIGVGDDDQSIYSFRRAHPQGIRRFPQDYPGSADFPLSITHRCGSRIIAWASHVISGDLGRSPDKRPLVPAQASPAGEVALLAFPREISEARGVADLVQHLIEREGVPPKEILVLLRTDHHGAFSGPIKEALEQRGIVCFDPGAVDLTLSEPQNRKLIALARLLAHVQDSLAWASILHLTEGIGDRFVEYLCEQARHGRVQLGETLLQDYTNGFTGAPATSRSRAMTCVAEILEFLNLHPVPDETPDGGWGQWLLTVAGTGLAPEATEHLADIFLAVDGLVEPDVPLSRYLGQLAPLAKDHGQTESQGVRVMTMAASKGLTVEATVVAGVEDGLIPRPDGDWDEERRLLYVAMTRAKRFLYCTWSRRRLGPTARAGRARVQARRRYSHFLDGGPVEQDGATYIQRRWG